MYDIHVNNENHRYYSNNILSHNSTITVSFLLWYILFHEDKRCAILANKGATSRQILARLQLAYYNLPKWIQQGIVDGGWNKGSISLENGSSIIATSTSSDSVRGESFSVVFIDECAFVPRNIWNDFWRSTYPTISSGKETKCIIVSTPNGQNQFYDIWSSAEEGRSSFKPLRVDWWDVPGRDSEWERVTRSNMSEEEFAVEYGNSFLGSSYTLIRGDYITKIGRDLKTPIQFSQTLRVYEEPELLNKYFITVDCADTGKDYSVISVFDITKFPYKHVAVFRDRISHLALPEIIQRIGQKYNSAPVLIENNDVGKAIINILNYTLEYPDVISTKIGTRYELGIRTTKKTKALGCKSLKDFIESGNLTINDKWTYEEIKHFVLNGMSYEAEEGYHDDIVMTLVTFSYFATTPTFKMHYDVSFADEYREKFKEELEERVLLPLPMFSDGRNDTPFFFKMNF